MWNRPLRIRRIVFILVVAVTLGGVLRRPADAAQSAAWKVGVSRENITPSEYMWMSGYGGRDRPAEGKTTDLWGKAMAVEDADGRRLVLVTLDLVGIDRDTSVAITRDVATRFGLPREAIAISTSHTHSGPVVGENLMAMYSLDAAALKLVQQYTQTLREKVVALVGRAIDDLKPAQVGWTVGRAHFAVNRRNNAEKDVPELRKQAKLNGPVDHDVPILVVKDPEGKVRVVLCGYACHATVLSGYQWSGDWPGYAQMELEQLYPGATGMVWIGCGADQNPIPRREVELAIEYGKALGQAVKAAADQSLIPLGGKLEAAYEEVPLEFAAIPSREAVEAMAKSDNKFEAGRGRMLLARWDRDGGLSKTYPYPVQSWRLGDGPTWIFLGGEVVVDFGLRLKLELGAGKTWVAGYCNDVMAYIASRRVLKEGGYEGATAMIYYGQPSPWAESSEDAIVSAARRQAAKLGGVPADEPRSIAPVKYPDHTDLTRFIDESGKGEKVETPADWQRRREDILESMQWVMGRLPKEKELEPLKVVERGRESFEKYDRLLITYHVAAGQDVTAHLYVPKGAAGGAKRSAVLALHPTSAIGKLVVAGDGPKANRNYAVELADRGYVVLAPDYPSFGELTDYPFHTDAYLSGTMTAIVNHRRGVDLLIARDDVDPERIAVIGHSLGGHNSMFVGVFDERIKAVVSSCGWDPFHYYYGGKLAGWASDRYMPRIREMHGHDPDQMAFDFPEVAAAIAPRAFFSCSPLRDSNFDYRGVKECEPNVRQVYRLLGAEENFVIRYPDSDHDFPPEVRQEAYEFLDRVLAGAKAEAAGK
ncbi:MAG: hypothetical protein RI963_2919 [Planctomycetota bacterium]|jgi:pimeloyl-ACP methyl ester carboxylesterase